jgi:hypothetical protein
MRPKELIKAEIVSQLQQQSLSILVDSLTEAQARIAELEAKIQELQNPKD